MRIGPVLREIWLALHSGSQASVERQLSQQGVKIPLKNAGTRVAQQFCCATLRRYISAACAHINLKFGYAVASFTSPLPLTVYGTPPPSAKPIAPINFARLGDNVKILITC